MKLETMTKATRRQAFDLAVKVHEGKALTPLESSMLINFFDKAYPKAVKDPWQYVAKVVNVKDIREPLRYVHVYDGKAYGTDGHRIHWAPTAKIDGYYTVSGEPFFPETNLMDIRKVIGTTMTATDKAQLRQLPINRYPDIARHSIVTIGSAHLQLNYLLDACNWKLSAGEENITFAIHAKDRAFITCELGSAIVMQVRI